MALRNHILTEDPVDIEASLSLDQGTAYSLQAVSEGQVLITQSVAAPSAEDKVIVVVPYEFVTVTPKSGESIYVWSPTKGYVAVVEED